MDPITAWIIVSGAMEAGKVAFNIFASDEKEQSIELSQQQHQLAYLEKTLSNYDMTNQILDRQLVQASARGVGLGSPSLEAIQRNTLTVGARRQRNMDIEEDIFEQNVKMEKENTQNALIGSIFGGAASFAGDIAGAYTKMPVKTG